MKGFQDNWSEDFPSRVDEDGEEFLFKRIEILSFGALGVKRCGITSSIPPLLLLGLFVGKWN